LVVAGGEKQCFSSSARATGRKYGWQEYFPTMQHLETRLLHPAKNHHFAPLEYR